MLTMNVRDGRTCVSLDLQAKCLLCKCAVRVTSKFRPKLLLVRSSIGIMSNVVKELQCFPIKKA